MFNRTGGGGTWSQRAYLKSPNADADACDGLGIGISLSRDGSTLAVAADFEDSGAAGVQGNQADCGTPMLAPSAFTDVLQGARVVQSCGSESAMDRSAPVNYSLVGQPQGCAQQPDRPNLPVA